MCCRRRQPVTQTPWRKVTWAAQVYVMIVMVQCWTQCCFCRSVSSSSCYDSSQNNTGLNHSNKHIHLTHDWPLTCLCLSFLQRQTSTPGQCSERYSFCVHFLFAEVVMKLFRCFCVCVWPSDHSAPCSVSSLCALSGCYANSPVFLCNVTRC